jgi:hypothetical protein
MAGAKFTVQGLGKPNLLATWLKIINDTFIDEKMYLLSNYGKEGEDYVIESDGAITGLHPDRTMAEANEAGTGVFGVPSDGVSKDIFRRINKHQYEFADKYNSFNGYTNINMPATDLSAQYGQTLSKLVLDYYVQAIVGEAEIDAFDDVVDEFNANGGKLWLDELNEMYASWTAK